MAKAKSGLPEGFDIGVTAADLTGPAQLPGYLDDDPALEIARMMKRRSAEISPPLGEPETKQKATKLQPAVLQPVAPAIPQPGVSAPPTAGPAAPAKPRRPRLQVNVGPEGERMVEELIDLVSAQSSVKRIKGNELINALILILYNARADINLGSPAQRGRWGTPTAKSFPSSLAEAFCEAIVTHDRRIGGNQFKKASGA